MRMHSHTSLIVQNTNPFLAKIKIHIHVGGDDEQAACAEIVNQVSVPGYAFLIQVGGWFVEQEQGGVGTDGEGELQALLHAGGEFADGLIAGFGEAEQFQHILGAHFMEQGLKAQVELHGFPEGELFDEFDVGGGVGQVAVHIRVVQSFVLIGIKNFAFGWRQVAGEYFEQSRFSRAVGAGDGVSFARLKLKADAAEYPLHAVALADLVQFNLHLHWCR